MALKISIVLLFAIVAAVLMIPRMAFYTENVKEGYVKSFQRKPLTSVALLAAIVTAAAVHICLMPDTWTEFVGSLQSQNIWYTVLLIATIDFYTKKIPNLLVLLLIALRLIAIVCLIIISPAQWGVLLGRSAIGLLTGVLFLGVCYLISRGGLGGGDVKLYCSLGFCYGFYGIMSILIYSLFASVVIGTVLLVSRKAKFKTTIPMAPFALIGLTIFIFIN